MTLYELLRNLKFESLTPIQEEVFKKFDEPRHIVGLAPTGTGKTHAYLLPLLVNLKRNPNELEAIILVPTNELVIQVSKMLENTDETVIYKAFYGSMDMEKEALKLKNNQPNLIITTPHKLVDLFVEKRVLNLKNLHYLILDEADMMFDEDFMSLIDPVLSKIDVPKFLLFSATLTKAMEPFIKKYFGQHIFIDTTNVSKLNIEYPLIRCYDNRLDTLVEITKRINPYLCFIFVSKNEDIERVFNRLLDEGLKVISISSNINVKQRKRIMEQIESLEYQYVVSSDLLSRGIDFKVSHVIHYDLPHFLEYFNHRSGRTGRMGDEGIVITLYDEEDRKKIDKLRQKGIHFVNATLTKDGLQYVIRRYKKYDKKIAEAIKSVPKPKKVSPGYKKKYRKEVKKAIQSVKKERYRHANIRKSR